jgi:hypothetical protein
MKKNMIVGAAACLIAAASLQGCSYFRSSEGWTVLFDGRDTGAFNRVGDANWKVGDGMFSADSGNGFLVTKETYRDFQIRVEFYAEADTNSGVYIRCQDPSTLTSKTCYEVNIWDTRPEPKYGTGAIVDVAAVNPMPKAGGKWNTYDITVKGDHFVVLLNGTKTADAHHTDPTRADGYIGLQKAPGNDKDGKHVIRFRKVEIRRL